MAALYLSIQPLPWSFGFNLGLFLIVFEAEKLLAFGDVFVPEQWLWSLLSGLDLVVGLFVLLCDPGDQIVERVRDHFASCYHWHGVTDWPIFLGLALAYFQCIEECLALYFPKDGMFLIKPAAGIHRDEELRAIHVGLAWISHTKDAPVVELQPGVELVYERMAVYALASLPCACRVTRLNHEVFNNSVEDAFVIVTFEAQLHEIPASFRRLTAPKLDLDISVVCLEHDLAGSRWLLIIHCGRHLL